jgi:peptide deformylase
MTVLTILTYPDERLETRAAPVLRVDDKIQRLAHDMAQTMYSAGGIGLAAPQVGVALRVVVADVTDNQSGLITLVNPKITRTSGRGTFTEGCLSIPGKVVRTQRAATVSVNAKDLDGKQLGFTAKGTLAMVIQHEIEHLDGVLFLQHEAG